MKTFIKWTLRLFFAFIAILIIVPLAATALIDKDDLKAQVDTLVYEKTGRHLVIDGPIGLVPGVSLEVYAENIRFENPGWASRADAITAKSLEASLSLPALLSGKVIVEEIVLDGFSLWLETDENGQINLVEPSGKEPKEAGPVVIPDWLEIEEIRITNSEIVSKGENNDFVIGLARAVIGSEGRSEPLAVDINGSLQKAGVRMTGTLGTLESVLGRTDSTARLVVEMGETGRASVDGRVGDVLAWKDVDFAIQSALPSLQPLVPLIPSSPSLLGDINVNARLRQPGAVKTMSLEDIDGTLVVAGIDVNAAGTIAQLTAADGLDIQVDASGAVAQELMPETIPGEVRPQVQLAAILSGNARTPGLAIQNAVVEIEGATATVSGEVDNLLGDIGKPLSIELNIADAQKLGEQLQLTMPALGSITATAQLTRADNTFALDEIVINNKNSAAVVAVKGAIGSLGPSMKGKLVAEAEIQPEFFTASNIELPVTPDPITATATLVLDGADMALGIDQVKTAIPGASVTATGSIPNLKAPTELTIALTATVNQLTTLGKAFEVDLPAAGPIDITATLAGEEGTWNLDNLKLASDNDGLKLDAAGTLNNLGQDMRADISVDGNLTIDRLLRLVPEIADQVQPLRQELQPINLSGRLVAEDAKSWSIQDLDVTSMWLGADLRVVGGITTFVPLAGELAVSLKGATEQQSALLKGYPIPPLDTVDISLVVPLPVAENGIRNISGQVRADKAILAFSGDVRQLSPLSGEGFNLSLEAPDLNALVADADIFKPGNAVKVDIEVALDPGEFSASGLVQVGGSEIDGSANWVSKEGEKSKLDAIIKSGGIDLVSLLKESEQKPPEKPEQSKSGKLLSEESLVPGFASKLDADIKLDVASINTTQINLSELKGSVTIKDDGIASTLSARNGKGAVNVDIALREGVQNQIKVYLTSFPVDAIQAVSSAKLLEGGTVDFELEIFGPSSSVAGLLEKGSGAVGLDIRNSRMANSALGLVGGDLLSNVVSAVNPFTERSDTVGVECAVIQLRLGNGKLETSDGIAMKTDRVTLLGGGEILFPSESLKFVIAPKARKGLGVSASSIAKMVRVGGTLSNPSIETDAKGLLKSGAAITAALASGGLTLFATGLLDRMKANSEVCAIARGDTEKADTRKAVNEAGAK